MTAFTGKIQTQVDEFNSHASLRVNFSGVNFSLGVNCFRNWEHCHKWQCPETCTNMIFTGCLKECNLVLTHLRGGGGKGVAEKATQKEGKWMWGPLPSRPAWLLYPTAKGAGRRVGYWFILHPPISFCSCYSLFCPLPVIATLIFGFLLSVLPETQPFKTRC